MNGAIDGHIEHHLFPDLPVERLAEIEGEVTALCDELGIPHEHTSLAGAVLGMMRVAAHFSLPRTTPTADQAARRALYRELVDEYRRGSHETGTERVAATVVPKHRVTLAKSGRVVSVAADETLLEALEREGVSIRSGCRRGACQTCLTPRLSGRTSQDERGRKADAIGGRIHRDHVNLCIARAESDVVLDLE